MVMTMMSMMITGNLMIMRMTMMMMLMTTRVLMTSMMLMRILTMLMRNVMMDQNEPSEYWRGRIMYFNGIRDLGLEVVRPSKF